MTATFEHGDSFDRFAEQCDLLGWQAVPTQWHRQRDGKHGQTPMPGVTGSAPFLDVWHLDELVDVEFLRLHLTGGSECVRQWAKPALRTPSNVTILDVDHAYEGKSGGDTLAKLEGELGPLPPSYYVTARGPRQPSRRIAFQHPEGLVIKDAFFSAHGGSIETVRLGHRFSWCPPAVHVRKGQVVGPVHWYGPDHEVCDLPHVDQLGELPAAWVQAIQEFASLSRRRAAEESGREFGEAFPITVSKADEVVGELTARLHDLKPIGGAFRDAVFGLAAVVTKREVARGGTEDDVRELLVDAFAAHPDGLVPDDADEQWISEGIEAGWADPWEFVSNVHRMPTVLGSEDFEHRSGGAQVAETAKDDGSEDFEHRFLGGQLAPVPLPGRTAALPLPKSCPDLSEFVTEVADALQVPVGMPLTMALPVLAAATGGHWEVQVRPGWVETLSICALVCQGAGERKSPVLSEIERPLKKHQAEARDRHQSTYITQETKASLARKRYEAAMSKAGKSDDLMDEDEAIRKHQAYLDAQERVQPPPTWAVGADGTPEAFVDLLVKHRAVGIISAEPGLFGALGGRYSSGAPNIEWFLSATCGERLDPRRIGRDGGSVERPVLSALSCIQPARLRELGAVKQFRDSGLLARHLFCIPDTLLGRRERPREINELIRHKWSVRVGALLNSSNKINLGLTNDGEVRVIRCTDAAAVRLVEFDDELEPELTPHVGRYSDIGDWVGKAVGAAARVAALFALVNDPAVDVVEVEHVNDAIALIKAYISHTIAAFALTDPASDLVGHAEEVLTVARAVCAKEERQSFTRREVHQKIRRRSWAATAEAMEPPLALLLAHGFIAKSPTEPKPGPGRPAERYLLNPAAPVDREVAAQPRTPRNRYSKSSEPTPADGERAAESHGGNPRNMDSKSSQSLRGIS